MGEKKHYIEKYQKIINDIDNQIEKLKLKREACTLAIKQLNLQNNKPEKAPEKTQKKKNKGNVCANCGEKLTDKVVDFCKKNKKKFKGKLYCYNCQQDFK